MSDTNELVLEELFKNMGILAKPTGASSEVDNLLIQHNNVTQETIKNSDVVYFVLPVNDSLEKKQILNSKSFLCYFNEKFNTAIPSLDFV
jgi:hypothetical protein